jgi:hypothetical protein
MSASCFHRKLIPGTETLMRANNIQRFRLGWRVSARPAGDILHQSAVASNVQRERLAMYYLRFKDYGFFF